jgi:hypothetical protein
MQVSTCWTEELPYGDSLEVLRELSMYHARLGGLHGWVINSYLEAQDFSGLCGYELPLNDPDWDVSQLYHCRQALGFFTKLRDLDIGVDKEEVAWGKFVESEAKCKTTNDLFRAFVAGTVCLSPRDVRLLESARRKIRKVLGRCPKISDLCLRFGPGATATIKRAEACPQTKFAEPPSCSYGLAASGFLPELLRSLPHYTSCHASFSYVDLGGYETEVIDVVLRPAVIKFVPKNAKAYRCTISEPTICTLLQCGIGDEMVRRLMRAGINLKDQQLNGSRALSASISDQDATVDLSSASDTICSALVAYLVDDEWYHLLRASRSGSATYRGDVVVLEKFSSMGNGFTFPLESLIFWALTSSVVQSNGFPVERVSVFGDDIVCPSDCYPEVQRFLEFCGFSVNMEKSFVRGPFRESCGCDYYKGFECRPYYQKHLVSGHSLFTLHNFYARHQHWDMSEIVKKYIPHELRIYGPDGYGDGHLLPILGEWPKVIKKNFREKGFSGSCFDTYSLRRVRLPSRYAGDYVSPLYSIYRKGREELSPRLAASFVESRPVEFSPSGRPIWTVPGDEGYRRTSIYIFA